MSSIHRKLAGVVFALSVVIVAFLSTYFCVRQIESVRSALHDKAATYARLMAKEVEPSVAFDDKETVREVFAAAAEDQDVSAMALYDAGGRLVLERGDFTRYDPPSAARLRGVRIEDARTFVLAMAPVVSREGRTGTVAIEISCSRLETERRAIERTALCVGVIALLAGFVAAWTIGRSVGRRLSAIARATRAVAAGDLTGRPIDDRSADEVGQLAGSFNAMFANLRALLRQISESNARETERLDRLVLARTNELEGTNQELLGAKRAAEAAAVARAQFLATMSHEVRTPISAVLGLTELILDGDIGPRERGFARTIRDSGEALLSIVNDILDFSKLEAGGFDLEWTAFDVRVAVANVAALLGPRATAKGLMLRVIIDEGLPALVRCDSLRLRQILINLTGNAIKFTSAGEVSVRLGFERGEPSRLTFAVRDTGIGIPPDRLDRLFQPFSQLDASTSRRFGGTGLGLVISRDLARLMGGDLTVESQQAHGSTFAGFVQAKVANPDEGPAASETRIAAVAVSARGPLAILLVDDNDVMRTLGAELLRRVGQAPDLASDGESALACMRAKRYDLVLLDVQMPGMDGLEAARVIRAEWPSTERPMVVALTANAMVGDRASCLEAGMDDYVSKPFNMVQLGRVLDLAADRMLVRRRAGEENAPARPVVYDEAVDAVSNENAGEAAERIAGVVTEAAPLDHAEIGRLYDDLGPEVTRDVLERFMADSVSLVASIGRAHRAGSVTEIGRGAHTLKSTARAVGALRLSDMCAALEKSAPSCDEPVERIVAELARVRQAIALEVGRLANQGSASPSNDSPH
ncbi:MAG: ATP-binding protein [Polyangiaceae bacterium]|jgi:signal transduction histidine kinase/CheY-like chemotaxis protein